LEKEKEDAADVERKYLLRYSETQPLFGRGGREVRPKCLVKIKILLSLQGKEKEGEAK